MITASLLINIVVLVPVCAGMFINADWIADGYGPASAARGILFSVYVSILVMSMGLLFDRKPERVAPLLLIQVLYKLITPFAVGSFANPVVISNLLIAAMHIATLVCIVKANRR